MVSLLEDGGPVIVISALSKVSGSQNTRVIEDGAREDPRGGLHQEPGPGVAGARVGDERPDGQTVSHREPGAVPGTLRVPQPEVVGGPRLPLEVLPCGQVVGGARCGVTHRGKVVREVSVKYCDQ